MRTVDATPRAALLVSSMRDVGYSLPSALADIIDNSIAAAATRIDVLADPSARFIAVVDNGRGMTENELFEVMRPGSRGLSVGPNDPDLGRFGLGLKSASFSQCRRLTVVTKQEGVIAAATWDLDFVIARNEWLLQVPETVGGLPGVRLLETHGTTVIWERLDRVSAGVGGDDGGQAFTTLVDDARETLELVFHRYLSGDRESRKIALTLNDNPLKPYDPFHESHKLTMTSPDETIGFGASAVHLKAFTLPHHKALRQAEWDYQGGPAGHLRNQGFYLYRQRRLITHGTWFGLLKMGELTKLSRVRVDIGTQQDSEWKIDIKKASAEPPPNVKKRLRTLVESISIPSRRIYTGRAKKLAETARLPVWLRLQDKNGISYAVNPEHPLVTSLAERLDPQAAEHLTQLIAMIGAALPVDMLFADVSDDPINMSTVLIESGALTFITTNTASQLLEAGMSADDIMVAMKTSEPFRSHWDSVSEIVKRLLEVENG